MTEPRPLSERLAKLPPGRHLVPSDFVAQSQRQRILLAMTELVDERGYQKTTIELIAKTARVALVTFYEHFSGKEECFLAAFDESVDAAREVRALTSLGLKEAKDLVEAAPKPILEKVDKAAADKAKEALEAAGATVTVK